MSVNERTDLLQRMDAYWRAANYLSVGQIYLMDNPLLREPLRVEHTKPRLLGHWGTSPGLSLLYVHLNRVINERGLDMIFVTGPGHGGPALVANSWLEGSYSEFYPEVSRDGEGMRRLFRQFSFPGGIPSHCAPETPGSIHEGGELGYALAHAYGAAFDNPGLIVACVVGDGEAETGPLAASWHSNKFLNPAEDGAVLPVLHLNGWKIANPALLARLPDGELEQLIRGYGYNPRFVGGDEPAAVHAQLAESRLDVQPACQVAEGQQGDPMAASRGIAQLPADVARLAAGSQRLQPSGSGLHRSCSEQEGRCDPRLSAAGCEHAALRRGQMPAFTRLRQRHRGRQAATAAVPRYGCRGQALRSGHRDLGVGQQRPRGRARRRHGLRRRRADARDAGGGRDAPFDLAGIRAECNFTTHTPVEAGHDQFSYDLVERVLGDGLKLAELKRYGGRDRLNMTRLALSFSDYVNGVAMKHAEVSRTMFPGYRVHAITNGVHPYTWTAPSFSHLYNEFLQGWCHEPEVLVRADQIPDEAIWMAHVEAKRELIEYVRERTGTAFDPDRLTIGFARRMTAYKRPDLLFTDVGKLLAAADAFPLQIVLAGKAHPKDGDGKELIRRLHAHAAELSGRVPLAFIADYDMAAARRLVAGVDVWLNTPRPPLEASGTSGMKAAFNGVPSLSVLDGWWIEGCVPGVTGWDIDVAPDQSDAEAAAALYARLRDDVAPLYYRERSGWIAVMKGAISKNASRFNSHRMLRRYVSDAYFT